MAGKVTTVLCVCKINCKRGHIGIQVSDESHLAIFSREASSVKLAWKWFLKQKSRPIKFNCLTLWIWNYNKYKCQWQTMPVGHQYPSLGFDTAGTGSGTAPEVRNRLCKTWCCKNVFFLTFSKLSHPPLPPILQVGPLLWNTKNIALNETKIVLP